MSALLVKDISKTFGAVQALKPLSMGFEPGEVTAIVGDNGAGKSVLLKLLAGVFRPDGGSIKLGKKELTRLSATQRRAQGIEMVYQDLALAKQQDVITNLYMGREIIRTWLGFLNRKAMTKEAERGLGRIGIKLPDLRMPVGLMSGGQQQAVAIARAAQFNPKVLLLDEPTAALGAHEVQQVLDLIRWEKEQGRIVVFVSHRLNDVFAVADRIVVMKQGVVVADTRAAVTSLEQVVANIVG
ncbi:MAG: ATP-binding cassette domain-containing protein [Alphaproteobacteria bacterium]|nr:ATP-binding cassette domain-containing protein [Alphaproteobacteria bacterium]